MIKNAWIEIERIRDNGYQTLGRGKAVNGDDTFSFVTLEPSWVLNETSVSCIPTGEYETEKRQSAKFSNHFHLKDVPDRSYILIHAGNYRKDTEGCIVVGNGFARVDSDNQLDVSTSSVTLAEVLALMPDKFLTIIQNHSQFQTVFDYTFGVW